VHNVVTPGEPGYAAGAKQQAAAISTIVEENDCRVRRALADNPPPPKNTPCKP
jgi:hypothetical protein